VLEPGASLRYRTNDVARAVGIHPSTVRRFDKRGLLVPKRSWAGHRRYSPEDLVRLRELVGLTPAPSEADTPDPETVAPKVPS
jgi:2-hydroxychromene-2-carboxylate isomerase